MNMAMANSHRSPKKSFVLYYHNTSLGWKKARRVNFDEGERQVALRQWQRIYDSNTGQHIGYQPLKPEKKPKTLPGDVPVAETITREELELNAGQAFRDGQSGSAERRMFLVAAGQRAGLPEEDAVEVADYKVKHYRRIGDDKATRV